MSHKVKKHITNVEQLEKYLSNLNNTSPVFLSPSLFFVKLVTHVT